MSEPRHPKVEYKHAFKKCGHAVEEETLADQFNKIALAKRAEKIIDFDKMKDAMIKECRVLAETGAMSRTFTFRWLDVPEHRYNEASEKLGRLLGKDGFRVTRCESIEAIRVSWE